MAGLKQSLGSMKLRHAGMQIATATKHNSLTAFDIHFSILRISNDWKTKNPTIMEGPHQISNNRKINPCRSSLRNGSGTTTGMDRRKHLAAMFVCRIHKNKRDVDFIFEEAIGG